MSLYEMLTAKCAEAGHTRVLWASVMRWLCTTCGITWSIALDTPEENDDLELVDYSGSGNFALLRIDYSSRGDFTLLRPERKATA